jgi:hypothetical protein
MIHYHGTPVSGKRTDAARFLVGRHALISFYRPDDLAVVMECCQSFVLDNGAFSHWRAGKGDIDFWKYYQWVEGIYQHPAFDWCIIPDKIDGSEQQNKDLVRGWINSSTKANSVPVYHLHESIEYLYYLMDNFGRICLGSSGEYATPNTAKWWARMKEIMRACCDFQGRPLVKLHGLRMLNPKVFTRLPLSSADSTNATVNCGAVKRFGMYAPATAGQRAQVIAERIEQHNSAPQFHFEEEQQKLFA